MLHLSYCLKGFKPCEKWSLGKNHWDVAPISLTLTSLSSFYSQYSLLGRVETLKIALPVFTLILDHIFEVYVSFFFFFLLSLSDGLRMVLIFEYMVPSWWTA